MGGALSCDMFPMAEAKPEVPLVVAMFIVGCGLFFRLLKMSLNATAILPLLMPLVPPLSKERRAGGLPCAPYIRCERLAKPAFGAAEFIAVFSRKHVLR